MATGKSTSKRKERVIVFGIILSILGAWIVGICRRRNEITPFLPQALPIASHFDPIAKDMYKGSIQPESQINEVGYVAIRSAQGYAGPVIVAVGLDPNANIVDVILVKQTETPAFFRKIAAKDVPRQFRGKHYADPFEIGNDIAAITGATVSLTALTEAVQRAGSDIASHSLRLPAVIKEKPSLQFGVPEIVLILLLIAGFLAYGKTLTRIPYVKWIILFASLVFLGFVWKRPLSLINLNSFLIGYWPHWQTNLYWYLLLAAILIPAVLSNKSPYCNNICPFGATQEMLAKLGGTKRQVPQKLAQVLKIFQWFLAWFAILCALLFRNPAIVSYEVSATFFTVIGQYWQYILLALVLILSLFITRPWCHYLCPIRAVTDYVRILRRSLLGSPTTTNRKS